MYPVVTTDSRNCPKDSLFFGIKGQNFDGSKFAQEAINKGCAYAYVDTREYADNKFIFYVGDIRRTLTCTELLQYLGNRMRNRWKTPVIGVTGTNGKTTTKELIASVLKQKYDILYTEGNLNNHLGVPLTLLKLKGFHDYAIIEMGANHPGEIKTLTDIARPDYGIITNVGKAHIEGFGSFEGVIKTKCELYDSVKRDWGTIFVNQDDPILKEEAIKRGVKTTIFYGKGTKYEAEIVSSDPFLTIQWKDYTIHSQLIGRYNFDNILAAITIGKHLEVEDQLIVKGIEEYTPTNNRSQYKKTEKNQLIIDAYNANPTSMNASLDNFIQMKAESKTVILGDMKELGHVSDTEHQNIADKLNRSDIQNILLVGENFAKTTCSKAKFFADVKELNEYLESNPFNNQTILVKGSNSMKLIDCIHLL